jgi:Xaa-Pro aminopeptidase
LQQSIFDHIAAIQAEVPARLKPGVHGRDLWRWMDARVREHPALASEGLIHHAGHSIGLHVHEMPDLNRDRGGILEAGNVVCVEPGGYTAAARRGARIENTYLITESGAVNLSEYPICLTLQHED